MYLADFEAGGPLSTVTILSSIETPTSTVDIRRSENLLSTNYFSSFLLFGHTPARVLGVLRVLRVLRVLAERRGGVDPTV